MSGFMQYYNNYNEEIRTKRSRVHTIEFITNVELVSRFMQPQSNILDVGAGTGVYSFYFAKQGHSVEALDIVPKHVEEMNAKKAQLENKIDINIDLGNALNLTQYKDSIFDMVICFGPIYHLRNIEDRMKCIAECKRVLKPGGYLALAYLNKNFIVPRSFMSDKNPLEESHINDLLDTGNILGKDEGDFLSISHFDKPIDVVELVENQGMEVALHGGAEGIAPFISEKINNLSEIEYKLWLDYHLRTCTEDSIIGISNHGLLIAKK